MSTQTYSSTVQDYLQTIYGLQDRQRPVPNRALKARLAISPAAISEMVQHLVQLGLVQYEPYHGVILTKLGEHVALDLVRRHRLLEAYLYQELAVPWAEVHAEADRLEHALSDRLADRIAAQLAEPLVTPYGAAIPTRSLRLPLRAGQALQAAPCDHLLQIVEVDDISGGVLRTCARLGLVPGRCVRLHHPAAHDGRLALQVGGRTRLIDAPTVQAIRVRAMS